MDTDVMDIDYNKISAKSIQLALDSFKISYKENSTKEELNKAIKKVILNESFQWIHDYLDKDEVVSHALDCTKDKLMSVLEGNETIHATLVKLSESLIQMLSHTCEVATKEESETLSFNELVLKIEDEVQMQGVYKTLHKLELDTLKSFASDFGITVTNKTDKKLLVDQVLNVMCSLEDNSLNAAEETAPPPEKPAESSGKKPATSSKKKPAAATAKETKKKPAANGKSSPKESTTVATTTTSTADSKKTKSSMSNERMPDISGKRNRVPVLPTPPPVKKPAAVSKATTNGKSTTTASGIKKKVLKRKAEEEPEVSDDEEDEEEDEEELTQMEIDDRKKGITGRNEAGGYYQNRVYHSPSLDHIKKGVSSVQLNDWYCVDDLKEYCKNHELKVTGNKSALIKNVMKFLGTGKAPPKGKKLTQKQRANLKKKQKIEEDRQKLENPSASTSNA